jgi:hypothetical protein
MAKKSTQTINGKAFEYSILQQFLVRLAHLTDVSIVINDSYYTAERCYNSLTEKEQSHNQLAASFAINFLLDLEPRLADVQSKDDILELEIVSDKEGQSGDVRDVLAIRSLQKWEIGVSAKNNHRAVKHSRLSNDIDFGEKWLGLKCSPTYFNSIKPIFSHLDSLKKKSGSTMLWEELGNYHQSVYVPVLNAFKEELLRLDSESNGQVANRLVEYLIGTKDFYKVIKSKGKVEIQAFNLHGTLNLPSQNQKPKAKTPKLKLPSRLIEIVYQSNSNTTLLVTMNEGWQISFRIHNASSRIEPSLKFDINLVSSPHSLFTNKLFTS